MRISFVTPSLAQGGYEKVVIAYANELADRGHNVDILCGHKEGELLNTVSRQVSILDFQARAREFLFPLVKYLKTYNPDILYCAFREYNCIGVLAKKIVGSDVCVYASQHGFQRNAHVVRRIQGKIIERADRLIAVGDAVADYEANSLGINRERFVVLRNPVFDRRDEIFLEPHPWFNENRKRPIIVMCGRLAPGKGIEYALKIMQKLTNLTEVYMMVLGDGPQLNELKQMSMKLNVQDHVDFLGYVNNPIGYMAQCDVFLHTALEEGFGNVVVEALHVGLIPCVTNCAGPMQIIENGEYGVNLGSVTDPGFVQHATERILDVLSGKTTFTGLQTRAACFDVCAATDQFLSILNKG